MRAGTPAILDALAAGDLTALVPGALADPGALWTRLYDPYDPFDLAELDAIADAVVTALTGWSPHAAVALAKTLDQDWAELDGAAAAAGVDLLALPARRVLAFVYASRVRDATAEYRAQLDQSLRARPSPPRSRPRPPAPAGPPAGAGPARPPAEPPGFSAAEQAASFRAVAAMIAGA